MDYDPTDVSAQERERVTNEDKRKLAQAQENADLAWLMQHKAGRRVVHRLLSEAGVYKSSFSTDALAMAFQEGQRNTGLRLLAKIAGQCPVQYMTMLKEHQGVE